MKVARRIKTNRKYIKSGGGYTSLSLRRPSTLPDNMYVRLDYAENLIGLTNAGGYYDTVFNANSPCFPYSGGHQPLGYDQFAAFYHRFRCLACSIDVTAINLSSSQVATIAIIPTTVSTSLGSGGVAWQTPRAKRSKFLVQQSRNSQRLKMYCTTREILGLTEKQLYDNVLSADVTSVVVVQDPWYYHVVYQTISGGYNFSMSVKLSFYVQFYDRVSLAHS